MRLLVWLAFGLSIGFAVGALAFRGDSASGIKIELAPNGMAYCPADSSTPHPTPCMFRQP